MRSRKAAIRVKTPRMSIAPQTIFTQPTNGPKLPPSEFRFWRSVRRPAPPDKKILNAFGQKYDADDDADQNRGSGSLRQKSPAHNQTFGVNCASS